MRNSADDPIDALAAWLDRQDGGRRPAPDAEAYAAALESRYDIVLPDDFRRYLIEAAPAEDLWDDADAIWWAPARIRNIPEEYEHPVHHAAIAAEAGTYLFFADFMIWCWAWAICCSDGPNRGRIAIIAEPEGFVADSFSEFAAQYVRDPRGMAARQATG